MSFKRHLNVMQMSLKCHLNVISILLKHLNVK